MPMFSNNEISYYREEAVEHTRKQVNEIRNREFFRTKREKRRLAKAAGKRRHNKEEEKRLEEFGF